MLKVESNLKYNQLQLHSADRCFRGDSESLHLSLFKAGRSEFTSTKPSRLLFSNNCLVTKWHCFSTSQKHLRIVQATTLKKVDNTLFKTKELREKISANLLAPSSLFSTKFKLI